VAPEAVTRSDALFDSERRVDGLDATSRRAARQQLSRPPVEGLHDCGDAERDTMSKHNPVAKAIACMFKADRREAFTRFLEDGRLCLTNNAAERALRGVAPGRTSRLFAGSERGGARAAFMHSPVVTARTNDIDPRARRADVLARPPDTTASQGPTMRPWNRQPSKLRQAARPRPAPHACANRAFLTKSPRTNRSVAPFPIIFRAWKLSRPQATMTVPDVAAPCAAWAGT
jgi:hypothetical protein